MADTEHMEINNVFSNFQGGFRKGKSTISTVYSLLAQYVIENKNNGMYAASVYLDLAKAFNTVDHTILIEKLE